MKSILIEIAILFFISVIIILIIIILMLSIIYMPKSDILKEIPPATYYSTIEYNGHTYIQNRNGNSIVHNPVCTNSKCLKD